MCIYIPHISHHVSWRFTILLSEIERQLVKAPLAAAISPFFYLTHPPNPCMKCEMRLLLLLCICLARDHRRHQNVVRTSETAVGTRLLPRVPLIWSCHIVMSSISADTNANTLAQDYQNCF